MMNIARFCLAALLAVAGAAQAQIVLLNPSVNDGSFDVSYGSVVPGTGNTVQNSDQHAVGAPIRSAGLWSYSITDLAGGPVTAQAGFGFAEFGSSLGPGGATDRLANEGSQNPTASRYVSAFCDPANRKVTFTSTSLTLPGGLSAGNTLNWAFDLNGLSTYPTPNGAVDFAVNFGAGYLNLITNRTTADAAGTPFEMVSGTYVLQAADLVAGTFSVRFSIANKEASGGGNAGRLFLDNIVLSVGAIPPPQTNFYVATTGNDTNSGTFAAPFATIQRAANVVAPGGTVFIRGGTYRETVTVPVSGTLLLPITFTGYSNETVVISGGDLVTGWTVVSNNIWSATNNWNIGTDGVGNTLFDNGVLKFEAAEGAEGDPLEFSNWGQIPSGQMTSTYFTAPDLAGWGANFWVGAKVRCHVNDWTIAAKIIAAYDTSNGRVTFDSSVGTVSQKHTLGYTIYDTFKALNLAGEWFKDRTNDLLYYQVPPGQNPNTNSIEFKRRDIGIDVRGRDYIRVSRITFRGTGLIADGSSDYNVYDRNYIYGHDRGGFSRTSLSGTGNTFRDNEVAQTWNSVLSISGADQRVVNNYFHDIGYNGTTRVISMSGEGHLVSYNTVRKFARSFLDGFPYRSEFAYNLFEDGANLSWDTGVFDGDAGRGNGGGCIVHHNVFRNSPSLGIYAAFYSGTELVIHHNICHDLSPYTMRQGVLTFLNYSHNTWIGAAPTGNVNADDFAVESSYNNNLQTTADGVTSIGVDSRGNHNYVTADFVNFAGKDFRLAAGSDAIDQGIVIPGVNDGYTGAAPDAGALEFGQAMWKVGYDFTNLPAAIFAWSLLPGVNLLQDGLFANTPVGWTYTASPVWYGGNGWNTTGTGLARLGGNCMQLQPGDGMSRVFTGLRSNTWYAVGSETRLVDQRIECEVTSATSGGLTNSNHRGENYIAGFADSSWAAYNNVNFGTPGKYHGLEVTFTRPPGTPTPATEATLEVRDGGAAGVLLGEFQFNPAIIDSWSVARVAISTTTGNHNLYLVARGAGASLLRLANVRLYNTNIAPDLKLTIGVRNHGGSEIITRVGEAFWRGSYELFTFKTGPSATIAELFINNHGAYDAYLDRLAVFETDAAQVNVAPLGSAVQSSTLTTNDAARAIDGLITNRVAITANQSNSWWQVDLGAEKNLYGVKLTAPAVNPGQLSDFRVSLWATDPRHGGHALWERDYFSVSNLTAAQTIFLKPSDKSGEGVTELGSVLGRFVRVQLLGLNNLTNGNLGLAELEVLTFDEADLAASDADLTRVTNLWAATFAQIINVGELTLHNTNGTNFAELSNFRVSVWDRAPGDGGVILWQNSYFTNAAAGSVARGGTFVVRGDEKSVNGTTRLASCLARHVQVEILTTNNAGNARLPLVNAMIRSTEEVRPGNNLALAGTATQSSDHYSDSAKAPVAINSLALPKGDYTHTRSESNPWWIVDLGATNLIDQIVLFNRGDLGERVGNFRVSVWSNNPSLGGGTELWGKNYSYSAGDLPTGGSLAINGSVTGPGRLDAVNNARFVRVQISGTSILSLSEVQVWRPDTALRNSLSATNFNFDFGTANSPVQSGFTRLSPNTHGDATWFGAVSAVDRGAGGNLNRDFIQGSHPVTLNLKLTNGLWSVTLAQGDNNMAHDNMMVWAEGLLITTNATAASGTFSNLTFTTTVADGELNLQFDDNGGSDPDWVINSLVLALQTSASTNLDLDADGLPNDWELAYFGNSTNAVAGADNDGDAFNNLAEYIAGTIPTNAASRFIIISVSSAPPAGTILEWSPSITNRYYDVLMTTNLAASFSIIQSNLVSPQSRFTNAPGLDPQRLYRVRVRLP